MLDFICPFCKKEILNTDDVVLGNVDDVNFFDLESTPKVFIHTKCLQENKKE